MPFTDLILRTLDDQPGMFEGVKGFKWRGEDASLDVPAGFVTDLASIPIGLRSLFSRTGRSRKPAVAHDYMYFEQMFTRKRCDQLFKAMLIERGVWRWQAQIYYIGVRCGGWKAWNDSERR